MLDRFVHAISLPITGLQRGCHGLWVLQQRERQRLYADMQQMRSLLPLLMKQRNGYRWTDGDRRKIRAQLRTLAQMSPYLVLFVSPGGIIVLPALAWWLDRRRQRRETSEPRQLIAPPDALNIDDDDNAQ